ncbi:hypothetical protein MMC30_000771 [Trapelia coarctata]|nr:hypothetical protein [Trapelia coarctata]
MQFSTTRLLTRSLRLPPSSTRSYSSILVTRPFSSTTRTLYPRKDSQDKDSINNESTEYSKSGSDDQAARQEDAAYNPNKTDPEDQKETAAKGNEPKEGSNPLEVSPANPEVSKQRDPTEGGAENASGDERSRSSGGGSPNKGKKVS